MSRASHLRAAALLLSAVALLALAGCGRGPGIIPAELRKPIDRSLVEFPAAFELERFATYLTAPTAMTFDANRNYLLVAESGAGGTGEPRILAFNLVDGTTTTVYPQGKQFLGLRSIPFRMYGPIGGLVIHDDTIYVSHRDENDFGVISALSYDGKGTTVVGGLPAQGDYAVTDVIAVVPPHKPEDARLYFGVGAATNSGVIGLDNWDVGWPQRHPRFADRPWPQTLLRGPKFFTNNPRAGWFAGSELAITAPFQPFGVYYNSRIDPAPGGKPGAAIYSVKPTGGIPGGVNADLRVEAHGIRYPAGLVFDPEFGRLYASNQGMQLRGSRPVRDDPDAVLHIRGVRKWMGWPDFSADLQPITDEEFQPIVIPGMGDYLRRTGNTELTFLLDHGDELTPPDGTDRRQLVLAKFPAQSGASKMALLPDGSAFDRWSGHVVVALSGDRAPFATMGKKLRGDVPVGRKVVRFDPSPGSNELVQDFIRNTAGLPRSKSPVRSADLLERPVDVKVGPDGHLYVLDFGRLDMRGGKARAARRTGQIFRLRPAAGTSTTAPAEEPADEPMSAEETVDEPAPAEETMPADEPMDEPTEAEELAPPGDDAPADAPPVSDEPPAAEDDGETGDAASETPEQQR